MKVQKICVEGLFETFRHNIVLKNENNITLIYGPNGFGKTTLLKMINDVFNFKYFSLYRIAFKKFTIEFNDGDNLIIEKISDNPNSNRNKKKENLKLTINKKNSQSFSFALEDILKKEKYIEIPPSVLSRFIPGLERIGPDQWQHPEEDEIFPTDEIFYRLFHLLPPDIIEKNKKFPEEFSSFIRRLNVRFIQTQRLILYPEPNPHRREEPTKAYTVLAYSQELVGLIKSRLAEYASLSQNLDSTFPNRLVESSKGILNIDEIRNKLEILEKKRNRLMSVGLLDKERDKPLSLSQENITEEVQPVLSVYVADVEKKLSFFDEMLEKIELFLNIINNKFLYKKFSIDKDTGFQFSTQSGRSLSPEHLSSGEQHELVMLYEMLFKVKANSLILIDEPEISLHVHWQSQFLDDLQKIAKLSSLNLIIATHSPEIINDKWDLTVELKGPQNDSNSGRSFNS